MTTKGMERIATLEELRQWVKRRWDEARSKITAKNLNEEAQTFFEGEWCGYSAVLDHIEKAMGLQEESVRG